MSEKPNYTNFVLSLVIGILLMLLAAKTKPYLLRTCYDEAAMRLANITALNAAGTQIEKAPSEDVLREALFGILRDNVLASISTVRPDGRAHINTAYFSYSDELELYFLSHPDSLHSQNLRENPSTAIAVFSSAQSWATCDIGMQLFGTCALLEGEDAKKAEELYARRFPGYGKWKESASGISADYRFYGFAVADVKVLDEARLGDGIIVSATIKRM